ncbi:MAG TPA: hypothetical protein VG962_13390 [Steroidobacteraceae bacterium]|nr:hypothetical protein [Steroidobacteraceae bacterium]
MKALIQMIAVQTLIVGGMQMSGLYRMNTIHWFTPVNVLIGAVLFYAYGTITRSYLRKRGSQGGENAMADNSGTMSLEPSKTRIAFAFTFMGALGFFFTLTTLVSLSGFLPGKEMTLAARVSQIEPGHSGGRFCKTNIYLFILGRDQDIFICYKHVMPWARPLGPDNLQDNDIVSVDVRQTVFGDVIEHVTKVQNEAQ